MKNRKLLFFDVDGTIWDTHNYIPKSTAEAIRRAREQGHLTFINTGRSRAYVKNPKLLDLGFDGIISGCGTMIELHGESLFYHEIEKTQLANTIRVARKYNALPILEGRKYVYMDYEDFCDNPYGSKVMSEMGENLLPVTNPNEDWMASKLILFAPDRTLPDCEEELAHEYDFLNHTPEVAELVPKGFNKGYGIKKLCELLDEDLENTFAFGDSINDIDMLKTAGTSIVMGNANDHVKSIGDYVTTELENDGIYNACKHFGLI